MMVTRSFKPSRRGLQAEAPVGVPRIAKLMALAICFDRLIREGAVADQAELAKVGKVTRARLTQILDLMHLAPQIQSEILISDKTLPSERQLRPISTTIDWTRQTAMWISVCEHLGE